MHRAPTPLTIATLALAAFACAKDPNYGPSTGTGGAPPFDSGLPASFKWTSTGPLITAKQDTKHPIVSVKDPSVVYVDGRWHVFTTTANTSDAWSLVYRAYRKDYTWTQ